MSKYSTNKNNNNGRTTSKIIWVIFLCTEKAGRREKSGTKGNTGLFICTVYMKKTFIKVLGHYFAPCFTNPHRNDVTRKIVLCTTNPPLLSSFHFLRFSSQKQGKTRNYTVTMRKMLMCCQNFTLFLWLDQHFHDIFRIQTLQKGKKENFVILPLYLILIK